MKSTEVAEELRAFEGNIRPPDRAQAGHAGKCQHVPNNQVIGALRNIHTMKSPLKALIVCMGTTAPYHFQKVDLSMCITGLARVNEGEAGCGRVQENTATACSGGLS